MTSSRPPGWARACKAVGDTPHDWVFPRMAAVVHHAGAGTTAAGLRAGVPAVTVPMYTDQPFWARRVTELGTGPAPVPLRQLTADRLAAAIREAVSVAAYRERARDLADRIRGEDGAAPVLAWLEQMWLGRSGRVCPLADRAVARPTKGQSTV
ncbi:glycosyltransferase [Micromonospora sp. NBC_01699]|uniref:glycosyltransferase n=1 Tax=Micromonospora sp. NBC_01699 TaxID=2975984 RepID=UPI003FA5E576